MRGLLAMKERDERPEEAALFFHLAICYGTVQIAEKLAKRTGERKICLSGGCFANRLLLQVLEQMLRGKHLLVYRNEQVPGNDGGIALGQAYLAGWLCRENKAERHGHGTAGAFRVFKAACSDQNAPGVPGTELHPNQTIRE